MNAFTDMAAGLHAMTHVVYLPLKCQHQGYSLSAQMSHNMGSAQ
jgi:hypothetical protein